MLSNIILSRAQPNKVARRYSHWRAFSWAGYSNCRNDETSSSSNAHLYSFACRNHLLLKEAIRGWIDTLQRAPSSRMTWSILSSRRGMIGLFQTTRLQMEEASTSIGEEASCRGPSGSWGSYRLVRRIGFAYLAPNIVQKRKECHLEGRKNIYSQSPSECGWNDRCCWH